MRRYPSLNRNQVESGSRRHTEDVESGEIVVTMRLSRIEGTRGDIHLGLEIDKDLVVVGNDPVCKRMDEPRTFGECCNIVGARNWQ